MLEKILELLAALAVAFAGGGVAADHADPPASDQARSALSAVIARVAAGVEAVVVELEAVAESVTNERALQALDDAAAAKAAGLAKAAEATGGTVPAGQPVDVPPVDAPPVDVPPVPAPPVDPPPVEPPAGRP